MDYGKVDTNGKRGNDTFVPEQSKKMRPGTPIETTKICDLDDDCLEYIFKDLGLGDLLNVVHSSKCFKRAADLVFKNKYQKSCLSLNRIRNPDDKPIEILSQNHICVYDALINFRLLRCFGHLISDLAIHYDDSHLIKLDQYVNKYCADSLNEIKLLNAKKEAMGHLTKPFTKVEKVFIICGQLDSDSIDFNTTFPEMRHLSICSYSHFDKHFPKLESLSISEPAYECSDILYRRRNVIEILRLNPQLGSLVLLDSEILDKVFIRSISEHVPSVQYLEINYNTLRYYNVNVIHFRNVQHLTLHTDHGFLLKCPLTFDQLKTLTILTANQFFIDSNFMELIYRHRSTLTKLCIKAINHMCDPFKDLNRDELQAAMEQLVEVDLNKCYLTMNEIINFLSICKMLKKLRFKLHSSSNSVDLLKRISSEWRLSVEILRHGCNILER